METTQPQNQITTLADLDRLISQKKQLLATADADFINLQKVTVAENYTIRQLLNQKADLENQLTDLQTNIDFANKNFIELSKEVSDLTVSRDTLVSDIQDKTEKQININDENRKTNDSFVVARESLQKDQEQLGADKHQFSLDKKDLDDKVSKLRDFVANLT